MSRDDPAEPQDTAQSLLQEVIDEWPQFDDVDAPVNGGDLVEWFGVFRERAKRIAWTGPASGRQTYIVTCYRVVRVPVDVEADSQKEAITAADQVVSEQLGGCMRDGVVEDAEETVGYLVDEVGDTDYTRSQSYDGEGNPEGGYMPAHVMRALKHRAGPPTKD